VIVAVAAAAEAIIPIASAPLAQAVAVQKVAVARDGVCDDGEVCFYYNSDLQGSVSDFAGLSPVSNYGISQPSCYEFKGPGAGQGLCIKNNVASIWNRTHYDVAVFYNSDFKGMFDLVAPGSRNLEPALKNNNASHLSIIGYW